MRLDSETKLRWGHNVGREHHLALKGTLRLEDVFETPDPATELALRSSAIRASLVRMLLETHLPGLIADTGVDPVVPGRIRSRTKTRWKSGYALQGTDPAKPRLVSDIEMQITVTTDRPVNAVQAFSEGKAVVAEAVADQLIHALRERYLGHASLSTESSTTLADGKVEGYRAVHRSPGADGN